jgi:hypothetical protein
VSAPSVTILVGGSTATCERYRWSSEDKALLRKLTELLDPRGPTTADPWPEWTVAQEAIRRYGGRVIGQVRPRPPKAGVVY